MRAQYTPMVIMSAELSYNTDPSNVAASLKLKRILRRDLRAIIMPCLGSYKGKTESSVMVPLTFGKDGFKKLTVKDMTELGRLFEQESILYQDNEGIAWLIYCGTGERVKLGKLTMVSKSEARTQDAYTYVIESNSYWIAK